MNWSHKHMGTLLRLRCEDCVNSYYHCEVFSGLTPISILLSMIHYQPGQMACTLPLFHHSRTSDKQAVGWWVHHSKARWLRVLCREKLCLSAVIVVVCPPAVRPDQQQRAVVKFHISKKFHLLLERQRQRKRICPKPPLWICDWAKCPPVLHIFNNNQKCQSSLLDWKCVEDFLEYSKTCLVNDIVLSYMQNVW